MKRHWSSATSVLLLCVLRVSIGAACSGPPPPSTKKALNDAAAVFVAEVVSTEQRPTKGDKSGRYITEDATFKVLEVFKGSYSPGDVIHVISSIGPGPCGMSARNTPASIVSIREDGREYAPALSGRWLIYGYGAAPFELSLSSGTKPMEFGGDVDATELRRLTKSRRLGP